MDKDANQMSNLVLVVAGPLRKMDKDASQMSNLGLSHCRMVKTTKGKSDTTRKMKEVFDSSYIRLAWSRHILCDTTCCSYRNLPLDDFGQHACYTLNIHLDQDLCRCPHLCRVAFDGMLSASSHSNISWSHENLAHATTGQDGGSFSSSVDCRGLRILIWENASTTRNSSWWGFCYFLEEKAVFRRIWWAIRIVLTRKSRRKSEHVLAPLLLVLLPALRSISYLEVPSSLRN